jgi:hypothetical protein
LLVIGTISDHLAATLVVAVRSLHSSLVFAALIERVPVTKHDSQGQRALSLCFLVSDDHREVARRDMLTRQSTRTLIE